MTIEQLGQWEIRQRCDQVIAALDIPDRLTINTLVDAAAELHARPIHLLSATNLPTAFCGLLERRPDADYLLYNADASPLSQLQNVAHEVGHLLLKHAFNPIYDPEQLRRAMAPDSDPELVPQLVDPPRRRSARDELAAEVFAFRVIARASSPLAPPPRRPASQHRLAEAFDLGGRSP